MDYFICQGVGILAEELLPFLNKQKCIEIIKKEYPDEEVSEADFDIEDYFHGAPFANLAELLTFCDDTNTITYGDTGGCGTSYFYYIPSYPWERTENEPQSVDEVHERIIDAVLKLCDMPREQIEDMINDEIYDVGCG